MGKPLRNIVESIKEELSRYKITDDFAIDDEYLKDKVNDVRASLIREAYRSGMIDEKYYQQMCCLEVECSEVGCEISGVTIPSGIKVWYTDLPTLVQDIADKDIKYFGLMGLTSKWSRISMESFLNLEGNIWSSTSTVYTMVGNRIYIKNLPTTGVKFVCLVGILYNPVESCDFDINDDYPVPSDLTLQMLVKKDIMSTGFIALPDNYNDGRAPDVTDVGGQGRKK